MLRLLAAGLFAILAASAFAADRPNFVLINVDDLGYGDIGPYGSTKNKTPHLDRMAREGRKLTSHYGAPVCSPSRAALMTGCYPKRVLPIPHVLFPVSAVGLHPDQVTIAELLKKEGYATACIGKWHLGDQPEFLPTRQGFDEYFGIPYSNDMGTAADGSKSNPGQPLPKPPARSPNPNNDQYGVRGADQPPLPLLENERVVERVRAAEQGTLTRRYTDRAKTFIRKHSDKPFFLYLPHSAVHFPHYPAEASRGRSGNGLLNDWVEEVDDSVGELLATLKELNLDEKTLVIFTSDNGGSVPHGSSNGPLRGTKGQTYEGGIRVPTIVRWPSKIPAGTVTDEMTAMIDFLPTLVTLAGGAPPARHEIDGHDIAPLLFGEADASSPHVPFFYFRGLQCEAVRAGFWKLHLASGELYNLTEDVGEKKNIAAENADVVKFLSSFVAGLDEDLERTGIGPGCRPLGRVDKPLPLIDAQGKVREGFGSLP